MGGTKLRSTESPDLRKEKLHKKPLAEAVFDRGNSQSLRTCGQRRCKTELCARRADNPTSCFSQ